MLRAALAVDDDAVEAGQQPLPQPLAARGAPRQQVVGGEDGRAARPEEPVVHLWSGKPLDVQHVRGTAASHAIPNGCSSTFSGSRSRERRKSRDVSRVEDLGRA